MRALPALAVTALLVVVPQAPAAADRHTVLRFHDPRIVESSGLVDLGDGLIATVNDSGDGPYVYVVDRRGRTVGVTDYRGRAIDVESMAPLDRRHVWVGDTGGNDTPRTSVQVYRVPVGRGDRTVRATGYDLAYPTGTHDAETLLADPRTGRLYVVTKALLGGTVYAAPRHLHAERPNRLRPLGKVPGFLTDGTFLPDGDHVLLRGYTGAAVYTLPGLRRVGPSFRLPAERQGEGIATGPHGRILLSSEGEHAAVLQIRLPASVRRALAGSTLRRPSRSSSPSPSPSAPPTGTAAHRARADRQRAGSWWAPASGGAVVLLGGAWLWVHRRRRP
ncbi:MAG TPA: hypothetical protein VI452_12040 [Marmoricola sp.]